MANAATSSATNGLPQNRSLAANGPSNAKVADSASEPESPYWRQALSKHEMLQANGSDASAQLSGAQEETNICQTSSRKNMLLHEV